MKQLSLLAVSGLLAMVATGVSAAAQTHGDGRQCRESGPLPNQIRCFLEAAKVEGDVAICEGAYDFAVRFQCIALFAEHSGDPAPCERIPIRNNRLLLMRDSCTSGVAAATRSPRLCEQVQLDVVRDACYLIQVVELNGAPELCERITKTAVKESCLEPPADDKVK